MDPLDSWIEETVLLLLFLISTAANSLVLLVFCRRPGLRTISNKFVINLLASNLVTTTALAPALAGERAAGAGGAGGAALAAWRSAADAAAAACSLAALLAVLLIAADQHHAVTDPLRCHARLLQRRPAALIAAAWAAALLAGALRAAASLWRRSAAAELVALAARLDAAYAGAYLAGGVVVPALAVCFLYSRIYRAARSSGLRARAHGASAMQLHEPPPPLPDLAEEGDGLTLRIDPPRPHSSADGDRHRFGPFLLPPAERPRRCPSVASLRSHAPRRDHRSSEDLRRLPAVSSAPTLAETPLLAAPAPASRITSLRCRISNASLFRYREESRAARVGLLTAALVLLHAPHAVVGLLRAAGATHAAEQARTPALALLVLAAAASPFLFALRSRRVQREARRLLLPKKSPWDRAPPAASAAGGADGQQARAALELLRTLSPGAGGGAGAAAGTAGACARGSFSSGASTQLSSASDD